MRSVDSLRLAVSVNDDAVWKSLFDITVPEKYLTITMQQSGRDVIDAKWIKRTSVEPSVLISFL